MGQMNFANMEFSNKRKKTQKEIFFERMEKVVPFGEWCDLIRPYYYENGNGRQPIELEIMLRMYLVSNWYSLSDEATEDLLCENLAARKFVGVTGDAPDSTTLCKFRTLLQKHKINENIFQQLNATLEEKGILVKTGTIVDATAIEAPSSTRNKEQKRNPEMSSVFHDRNTNNKKAVFGFKGHIGVDSKTGLVHSVAVSTGRESDIANAHKVLHGAETEIYGDAGYIGLEKRPEICEKYQDGTGEVERIILPNGQKAKTWTYKKNSGIQFKINKRRFNLKDEDKPAEKEKSRIRWKVEHPFAVLKHRFGFRKTRQRTLAQNESKLHFMFTLVNLLKCSAMKISLS